MRQLGGGEVTQVAAGEGPEKSGTLGNNSRPDRILVFPQAAGQTSHSPVHNHLLELNDEILTHTFVKAPQKTASI